MTTYQICQSKMVYEVLHTEVILINFDTGDYFNLTHVAKQIWQMMEANLSLQRMIEILAQHYQLAADKVASEVTQFINQLLENQLITDTGKEKSDLSFQLTDHDWDYVPPKLQKYSDVQDLLLLDPIHAVAEAGWPEKVS